VDNPDSNYLLRHLLRAVYWFDESLQDHLESAGWPRTSRTKSLILMNIADGVTRATQIAANLGLSRQGVHLALEELRRDGLVVIEPDPKDKRANRIRFSPDKRAERMRSDALTSLHRIEGGLIERIGAKRFKLLLEAMSLDWGEVIAPEEGAD